MHVLWLASWYPSKADAFAGDFIQRHAQATSLFCSVYVLHVSEVAARIPQVREERVSEEGNLIEHIVYCRRYSIPIIGRLLFYFRFFALQKKCIDRYISMYGKPQVVHVHVSLKSGLVALWMKTRYKIPYVVTEHYDIYNKVVPDRFEKRSMLFRYLTRKVVGCSDLLLPVSDHLGKSINRLAVQKKYFTIPNVVDTSIFNFTTPPGSTFRFIHVSNLVPRKNVWGIIDAVKQITANNIPVELLIVGADNDSVASYAQQSGILQHVVFAGEVAYRDVAEFIKGSHAMVLFSKSENLPCVVLEALCCGRPVISTPVGGIPEVISKQNGILVDDDGQALLKAMIALMNNYSNYDLPAISAAATEQYAYPVVGKMISNTYTLSGA